MKIKKLIQSHWPEILLGIIIVAYIGYFSYFSILRFQTLHAHYFDLGIMNQTVYNTFMAFKTGDYSRFLELTNPHGFDQIKRMAIHNDVFLAFLAPLYFIYSGPETLLIIQTVAVGLGALAVYGISKIVFDKVRYARLIAVFFSCAYLLYPPLQRANQFDFHAVVLATPLLLFMYLLYLQKRFVLSFLCAMALALMKEQIGLTLAFFGVFALLQNGIPRRKKEYSRNGAVFGATLIVMGIGWFILSMTYIIPLFRHGVHFALGYFGDFGDSPTNVFIGLIKNPFRIFFYIFRKETYEYLLAILGPMGFLSFLSPTHLLIAAPELAINLLSKSGAMRNIYFHYTAVITPFVIISSMYGFRFCLGKLKNSNIRILVVFIFLCVLYFSVTQSPLPSSLGKEIKPFVAPSNIRFDAFEWQRILADDSIKVMATGSLAPVFSSRRYLYNFSEKYDLADYIVLSSQEVYNGYEHFKTIKPYEKLVNDVRFTIIYKSGTFEVYKKL